MDHEKRYVISSYSDENAVSDGILIGLHHGDRTTAAVWAWLEQAAPELPPVGWRVDRQFFHAANTSDKALSMAHGLITQYRRQAIAADRASTLVVLFAVTDESGKVLSISDQQRAGATKLWLMPNGNGPESLTLMFPDDY